MFVRLDLCGEFPAKGGDDKIRLHVLQQLNNVVLAHIVTEKLPITAVDSSVAIRAKGVEIVTELLINGIPDKTTGS